MMIVNIQILSNIIDFIFADHAHCLEFREIYLGGYTGSLLIAGYYKN